ncbi:hypothetical protein G9A89_001279 [Geosiphon pyriformis]|nr:hypothetical protein G9A89_001279 [Geosiphon pyriformis]
MSQSVKLVLNPIERNLEKQKSNVQRICKDIKATNYNISVVSINHDNSKITFAFADITESNFKTLAETTSFRFPVVKFPDVAEDVYPKVYKCFSKLSYDEHPECNARKHDWEFTKKIKSDGKSDAFLYGPYFGKRMNNCEGLNISNIIVTQRKRNDKWY